MSNACWVRPKVKNSNGEDVVSKLWKDIYRLTGNDFEKSKKLYHIASSETFKQSVEGVADFDENGQVTARSFFKLSGRSGEIDDVINTLQKEYNKQSISGEEALSSVEDFNAKEEYSEDYVPVIVEKSNDNNDELTYDIVISDRDDVSVSKTEEVATNLKIVEAVKNRLQELGVAYDFVGTNKYRGRFSTKNAKRTIGGLYHLITISKDLTDKEKDEVLLEEAAHLATVSMKDNPVMRRLINMINEDTIGQLFDESEIDTSLLLSEDGKLELAGLLVKKAFQNKKLFGFNSFLMRVKEAITNIFSRMNLEKVKSDEKRAMFYARKIANGFLFNDKMFDAEKLAEQEKDIVLYHKEFGKTQRHVVNILKEFNGIHNDLKNISSTLISSYLKDIPVVNTVEISEIENIDDEKFMATSISKGLENISESIVSLRDKVKDIDFSKDIDSNDIARISALISLIMSFTNISNEAVRYYSEIKDTIDSENPEDPVIKLENVLREINEKFNIKSLSELCIELSQRATAKIYESVYGTNEYVQSARLAFGNRRFMRPGDEPKFGVTIKPGQEIDFREIASSYFYDGNYNNITSIARLFKNFSNDDDLGNQGLYQLIRKSRLAHSIEYKKLITELNNIKKRVRKAGIKVTDFYEKYDDNSYTGNFIGEFNYSQYNKDRYNAEKKCKKEFLDYLKRDNLLNGYLSMTKSQKLATFNEFKEKESSIWNEFLTECTKTVDNKIVPSDKYRNDNYFYLCNAYPEFKELLSDVKKYKEKVDNQYLVDDYIESEENKDANDATKYVRSGIHFAENRIPQYESGSMRIWATKNDSKNKNDDKDLFGQGASIIDLNLTSDSFGSEITDDDSEIFQDVYYTGADDSRRFQFHGIKPLSDMSKLSENLFGSLELYTSMALKFAASRTIFNAVKLIDYGLSNRVGSSKTISGFDRFAGTSRAYRSDMIDQYIFNYRKSFRVGSKKFRESLGVLGTLIVWRVLCFGQIPALKNYFGGIRVVFQDALSGRYGLSVGSFFKSLGKAFNPVAGNMSVLKGKDVTWNKRRNLIKRWDALRDPSFNNQFKHGSGRKAFNRFISITMANYTLTDEAILSSIYNTFMGSKTYYAVCPYGSKSDVIEKLKNIKECIKSFDGNKKSDAFKNMLSLKKKYENTLKWFYSDNDDILNSDVQKINLTENGYNYDEETNLPELRDDIIKDVNDIPLYRDINAAISDLNYIINNKTKESPDSYYTITTAIDSIRNSKKYSEYASNCFDENGKIKSAGELLTTLSSINQKIMFTVDDESLLCEKINDYIASSQGLYGLINANALMSDANLAMFSKIKGWLFGFMQRNLFQNPSLIKGDYKPAVFMSELLALAAVFSVNADLSRYYFAGEGKEYTKKQLRNESLKMRGALLLCMVCPFLIRQGSDTKQEKEIREYLIKHGFHPDQLTDIANFTIGWIINWVLWRLCRAFSKGNYAKHGKRLKSINTEFSGDNFWNKDYKYALREHGIFFPEKLILTNDDIAQNKIDRFEKYGFPWSGKQPMLKNVKKYTYLSDLPEEQSGSKSGLVYVEETNSYYRYDSSEDEWYVSEKEGYFDEYEDSNLIEQRERGIRYAEYSYDIDNPLYKILGFNFRLLNGILDEGLSLMSPFRHAHDIQDIGQPLYISALTNLGHTIKNLTDRDHGIDKALRDEVNYFLKKWNLQGFNKDGEWDFGFADAYKQQEYIDNIKKRKR